jgi:hypothetical protein
MTAVEKLLEEIAPQEIADKKNAFYSRVVTESD